MKNVLYIVIPCYNEEEMLPITTEKLEVKINNLIGEKIISTKSKVLYVNDGSKDGTWELIKDYSKKKNFTGINLSRNKGHQNALLAGLMVAKEYADMVISMDADLQDDIGAIDKMIEEYNNGSEIVYGVRSSRKKDTFFKRKTAEMFYKFMKFMGVDIVYNHADFRLTSKRVLDSLENFEEVNLFLRGIFPLIGFKSSNVYYERNERIAGKSKYPLKKMLSFAWDGITSFSIKPIRLVLNLGICVFSISMFFILCYFIIKISGGNVNNIHFIICSIFLATGLQMSSIGLVGEYIGKIYGETKKRPRYIISDNLLEKEMNDEK